MTSPSAMIPGQSSISPTSVGLSAAPAVSKPGSAGTQDGTPYRIVCGVPRPASIIQRKPGLPTTLTISCGSANTVVVPRGRVSQAKAAGVTKVLSMCIWAST